MGKVSLGKGHLDSGLRVSENERNECGEFRWRKQHVDKPQDVRLSDGASGLGPW